MVNYLALLGWGPKDGVEVRPLAEIVERFRLEDVTSSPAFFDVKKLQAFNADHVRALPVDEFVDRARPFLSRGDIAEQAMAPLAELVQERVRLLTEVEPMIAFLIDDPVVIDDDSWTKAMVKGKAASEMLDAAIAALDELTAWEAAGIRLAVEAAAVAVGLVTAEGQPQPRRTEE